MRTRKRSETGGWPWAGTCGMIDWKDRGGRAGIRRYFMASATQNPARKVLRSEALADLLFVIGKIVADEGKIKFPENRFLGFAFQQELE